MEPKIVIIWVCVIIFAATGVITLLGIIGKIKIERSYLNRLFIALVLEIVAAGTLSFSDYLNVNKDPNKTWLVNAKVSFLDKNGERLPDQNKLVQNVDVVQSNPSIIVARNDKRVLFWVVANDPSGRNIQLNFRDLSGRFSDMPFNLKYDSINIVNGEIEIKINFQEPLSIYNAPNNPPSDSSKSNSIKNGPENK